MNFENLDKTTQDSVLEKAQYLINNGFETGTLEQVKQKVFEVVISSAILPDNVLNEPSSLKENEDGN
jgi:hypothetical protein